LELGTHPSMRRTNPAMQDTSMNRPMGRQLSQYSAHKESGG
jgi:hypothetical protein